MLVEIPIDIWDPSRGGLEGYLWRLARFLTARGHRVRILCRRSSGPSGLGSEEPIEVEELSVPRWPRWWREIRFARAALAHRRAGGADVTLAVRHTLEADAYQPHGGPFRTALAASLEGIEPAALRFLKRALRRLRPTNRVLLYLDREIFRRSEGLITLSLSGKVEEDFRRAYPGENFRFERLGSGVDLEEFHDRDRAERSRELRERFALPPEARSALFIGHKFGPKGLGEAVRALAAAPLWHLVVVGRGRPRRYRRLSRKLGVEGRVHFAGPTGDPRGFLAAADALVLPTRHDPCSLVVLEALACGTPAVTTTANGAGELMEPGREGFVVEPGDIGAVASALEAIRRDWDRFHAAALETSRRLSLDAHFAAMERVLDRAARERRARRGTRAQNG